MLCGIYTHQQKKQHRQKNRPQALKKTSEKASITKKTEKCLKYKQAGEITSHQDQELVNFVNKHVKLNP